MPFEFKKLPLSGLIEITFKVFNDDRGFFAELYKQDDFVKAGIDKPFVQTNYSHSKKSVLRGLHYQKSPMEQGKLVRVIRGEIFDVAVDIRRDSPTFGKWEGVILSEKNNKMLYIPEGFAHGFCVLSNEADVIYECTKPFSPEHDAGIIWNDPTLKITWPIKQPLLSKKDKTNPLLRDY